MLRLVCVHLVAPGKENVQERLFFLQIGFHTLAGGTLRVYCWNSKSEAEGYEKDFESDVHVMCDGIEVTVKAGGYVDVKPGNSITLTPYVYHSFEAVEADGDVIVGEVSRVNDDANDNHFNPYVAFEKIEEDVTAKYRLCGGYQQ